MGINYTSKLFGFLPIKKLLNIYEEISVKWFANKDENASSSKKRWSILKKTSAVSHAIEKELYETKAAIITIIMTYVKELEKGKEEFFKNTFLIIKALDQEIKKLKTKKLSPSYCEFLINNFLVVTNLYAESLKTGNIIIIEDSYKGDESKHLGY